MAGQERKIPAPVPNPETARFWEAAAEGKLLIKSCKACGQNHWYPRALCPFCFGANTRFVPASGGGPFRGSAQA